MEPTEIKEFTEQLEEGRENRLTHVSLAISILAVFVAMVTVMGHRAHTEAVLLQARASDQWNEYQAKRIRQTELGVAGDLLTLQPGNNAEAIHKKLQEYKAHDEKWVEELKQEQEKARDLEGEVALVERKASRYDLGEALLQIAVVLSSITLLTRLQVYFLMGLALGVAGTVIAATGFLLR
jgi:hypothetical protein